MTELTPPVRIGKGRFKCFHCRQIFLQKDGNWHTWKAMEVHLCKTCEVLTQERPERQGQDSK